jgi:arsenate reductase
MAEGWGRHLKGEKFEFHSAGIIAKGVDCRAVAAMAEHGIDISQQFSKTVDNIVADFDYVITVCDNALESCPIFPSREKLLHHSFPDPPALAEDLPEERKMEPYREVCVIIRDFIEKELEKRL